METNCANISFRPRYSLVPVWDLALGRELEDWGDLEGLGLGLVDPVLVLDSV